MQNLEQFGLEALDASELQEVQGGVAPIVILVGKAFLVGAAGALGKKIADAFWDLF